MSHDLTPTPSPQSPSLLLLHPSQPIIPQPFVDNRHRHACPAKANWRRGRGGEEGEGREGGDGGGGETGKGAQPVITSDLIAGKRHEACACGVVYAYA